MFSRGGKHALASSSNVREMKPPATTSFHAKSSPVLALAVDKLNEDKQLEEIKALLKSRKISLATPGVSGAARLELLKQRLHEEKDKEIAMVQYQQKRKAAETKHAAFKAYRSEQAKKRLELAVASGDASKVMAAVTSGADPNHVCRGGVIAIHQATEHDDADLITVLAKDGADVNKKSSYLQLDVDRIEFGESSVLEEGSVETISSVDATARVGPTPLVLACLRSCFSTVAALLTVGADPNISSRVFEHEDIVPLAIAAAKNDVKIVHALLDAGAVKHWMDASGRSPLMYAARCSSVDCVKLLVERGADPNAIDFDYKTALDWATIALHSADAANRDALTEIIRTLTLQTYQTRPIWKSTDGGDGLGTFPVESLLAVPRPHFVAPLRVVRPSTAILETGNDGTPALVFCNHCSMVEARIRCIQCSQQQCEKCCVQLHKQDGRRHHILKAIKSVYSAENQQVLALCRLPSSSLGNSIGVAKQTLEKMKEIYDESPLGSITLLREMEDKLKLEEMTKEIKEAAKQKLESNGAMRNGRRSSIDVQFLKRNKGLELFPVMTEARRKSDAAIARQIAIERAREKVRHLFDQAPELDLADFYIRNDKFVDAEAVLASFTRELKDKVPEEEWIWFRTRALVVRLKMRQLLWGAAVSAGKEALEPLHEDERFADSAVMAVVFDMADALVQLNDAEHGGALIKSCVSRVFHCEKDAKIRAAITQYMDKFDSVHSIWEGNLMSAQDKKLVGHDDLASPKDKNKVEPTESELVSVMSQPRWLRALKRVCRNDGTISSLRFILSVRQFRTMAKEALPQAAAELMRKFIKNPSILPVLPMVIKNRLRDSLKLQTMPTSFDECEKVVLDALVRGPLTRFLGSDDGRRYCRYRRKIAANYEKIDVSSLAKGNRGKSGEPSAAPATTDNIISAGLDNSVTDMDDHGVLEGYDGAGSETEGLWDTSGYDSGGATGDDTALLEYSADDYAAMTQALATYMKRYDFESGFPYFVNVTSGDTSWEVPPPYHTEAEFPYRTVCGQCDAATASKHCADCDNSFCESCFVGLHGRGSFRQHRYISLTDYDPVCCTCNVRFGLRSCLQCQASYCTPCLVQQHAMNAWSGHTFTTVEFGLPDAANASGSKSAENTRNSSL